jgi:hypothetical protein
MLRSTWCRGSVFIVALFTALVPLGVYAQSTASISGVVKDTAGAVLPGVSVTIKNDTTGVAQEVVSDVMGNYQAQAIEAGSYTVSASLGGFKSAVAKAIRVAPGQPVTIPLTLEIGQLEETVTVTSSSELINTQNATVAATLNSDQLTRLPTPTRNALNAVTFLPGINTTGTNRDSTINGLPESFVSISIDGVSNNDNFNRNTDSFFASITPRQDAVEAVAITLAAAGAQVGGGAGAVTVHGQRVRVLPEPELQFELHLQRVQPPGKERDQAESVRRTGRRPNHDPGPVRRPGQSILLLSLRADPVPQQLYAHAHGLQSASLRRVVPLPVRD